jgi:hypothetical protein
MKVLLVLFLAFSASLTSAFAQDPGTACSLNGPSYQLASDTVTWSMTIGSGQTCIRGLRSAFATIDEIELVAPPTTGQVKLEGPGFIYKTGSSFHGEDSFAISVTGKLNRISGKSTIRIRISVR